MIHPHKFTQRFLTVAAVIGTTGILWAAVVVAEDPRSSSYAPVNGTESFKSVRDRMEKAKPAVEAKHKALLELRYDLADKSGGTKMSKGKAVQSGPRAKLPAGMTWDKLGAMSVDEIRTKGAWPEGF